MSLVLVISAASVSGFLAEMRNEVQIANSSHVLVVEVSVKVSIALGSSTCLKCVLIPPLLCGDETPETEGL